MFCILRLRRISFSLTAQSDQNIRMKMGVVDIRLVDSIVVNIVDESLKLMETNNYRYLLLRDLTTH